MKKRIINQTKTIIQVIFAIIRIIASMILLAYALQAFVIVMEQLF